MRVLVFPPIWLLGSILIYLQPQISIPSTYSDDPSQPHILDPFHDDQSPSPRTAQRPEFELPSILEDEEDDRRIIEQYEYNSLEFPRLPPSPLPQKMSFSSESSNSFKSKGLFKLNSPSSLSLENETKTRERKRLERDEIYAMMRKDELKWARRSFAAFALFCVLVSIAMGLYISFGECWKSGSCG